MANQLQLRRSGTIVIPRRVTKKNSTASSRSAPENLDKSDGDRLRKEIFQNWLQAKKQEEVRKQDVEREMKLLLEEQKKIKKETAEISYALWKHKKDEEKKAKQLKERQLKDEQDQQKKSRQTESKERMSQWMKDAKFKPRPVRSNMGLLSLTATNPPSFYNPHPWVDPV